MSGFWSAFEDEKSSHKSIRELAYGHMSPYEPPTNHGVDNYREYYRPFQGPELEYTDRSYYPHTHHSPQGGNEHFCNAQLTQPSLLKQLEAQITELEMQIYVCTLCGGLGHLIENCSALHEFRQYRANQIAGSCQMHNNHLYPQTCDINPCFNETDNELNFENSMFSPSYSIDIEHEPSLEVNEWTRNTTIVNREMHICYEDDDDDVMLEKHVYAENIVEPLGSETLGFSASTFMNDVSSTTPYAYTCDVNTDLELVQLFCEDVYDLGKVEFSVDINNSMHENDFGMSDSLPKSQFDVSSEDHMLEINFLNDDGSEPKLDDLFCESEHDARLVFDPGKDEFSVDTNFFMHENNYTVSDSPPRSQYDSSSDADLCTLDSHGSEFGLVNLFNDCEHAATLADDLGDVDVTNNDGTLDLIHARNLDLPIFLLKSQPDALVSNLGLVCHKNFKPIILRVPSLGLELCASQVLLDYFAAKFDTFAEPQLECINVSLPIPNNGHFELDLVHDAPLKLLDFVPKSISIEKSRFGGSSSCLAASLQFLSCYKCLRLSIILHVVFWVDPQLFRLLVYGELFLYII